MGHIPSRRHVLAGLATSGLFASAASAQTQQTARTIKAVVTFPAGGALDPAARIVLQRMGEVTGNVYVVENRAGANGNVGGQSAVQAAADGNTFLYAPDAIVTVNPALYKTASFDAQRDLKVVAPIGSLPNILVVNPKHPAKTISDFIAYGRANEIVYGSGGIGSSGHLTMELLGKRTGMKLRHVPYRGAAPVMNDLVGGQIDAAFGVIGGALPQINSGTLRALAVSSLTRSPSTPDIPTVNETVVPGFEVVSAFLVFARVGTPDALVAAEEVALRKAIADPGVQERLKQQGIEPMALTMAETLAWLERTRVALNQLIKDAAISPQ